MRLLVSPPPRCPSFFFFFNDTATTEIYTLSLHDALPIFPKRSNRLVPKRLVPNARPEFVAPRPAPALPPRSEEHTSELQSRVDLVCRLLLEKKKIKLTRTLASTKTNRSSSN